MALTKVQKRIRIKRRVRSIINGTSHRPRLSVYKSNKEIYGQIIDDIDSKTLVSFSTKSKDLVKKDGTKTELATHVGEKIAELALSIGVEKIVFDRNGFIYHGRIKALADGARKGGLKF